MAVNLAKKYSPKVDERFYLKCLTDSMVNQEYEWSGVVTVTVWAITNATMNDYTRTGANRYGTPEELQDTIQDMTLTQDRSFAATIDQGNATEQMMVKKSNQFLRRQIDEVVIPEIDTRRLSVISAAGIANGHVDTTAPTASTAYTKFLTAMETVSEDKVPITGRIAAVTPNFYSLIKQDNNFIKQSEIGQKIAINGQVGEVDGAKIVMIPSSYFPANHAFILTHPVATVGPRKLEEYKVHKNPPGINGYLIEGRNIYDAFVLTQKVDAIFVQKTSA